ncbi:MAG: hypothetical protein M3Y79_11015 [Pseudomonadota bacterium]|jgi:hypothetical protein|nr:hypothetical protein [Pseudomonadota bacterium]
MSNEAQGDDLAATGEHPAPGASEQFAEWSARMQRGRGRHAAISRNLNTWSNYKNWSEKVRQSWESDVAPRPTRK